MGGYPATYGRSPTSVWVDEAANIDQRVHDTIWRKAQAQMKLCAPEPVVHPIQVACRYCAAQPGVHCQRWRRTKRGKIKQNRNSPHPDRKYDAKLATTALSALTSNR